MNIHLQYGTDGIAINLPDANTTIFTPTFLAGLPDEAASFQDAVRNPINVEPLRERIKASDKVADLANRHRVSGLQALGLDVDLIKRQFILFNHAVNAPVVAAPKGPALLVSPSTADPILLAGNYFSYGAPTNTGGEFWDNPSSDTQCAVAGTARGSSYTDTRGLQQR